MKAILIIDHGSRRGEANEMLGCMRHLLQSMAGEDVIVRYAHMELAEPTIEDGFRACVEAGASEVVAFPYMLSPGKHSIRDIPRMVAEVATQFPSVAYSVTPAFGVHEKLAELILARAGVEPVKVYVGEEGCRCWSDSGVPGSQCGDACRAAQPDVSVVSSATRAQ